MRIQHNIMAMNAYRNYTNNVSAMKANLEKLSSGYKINRAGDDAAGLAISEKMRAQITGLETAQKNAKDGISLVQTAEGAMTEVHDMLNRMVELATQSANGTYDNDTDRDQLQKELDQLRTEINRIADSSNFNGIKLLDGSMDANGGVAATMNNFEIAPEGTDMQVNTILNKKANENDASFTLELHGAKVDGLVVGEKLKVELGSETYEIAIDAANATKSLSELVAAAVTAKGTYEGKAITATADTAGNKVDFTVDKANAFNADLHVKLSVLANPDGYTATAAAATVAEKAIGALASVTGAGLSATGGSFATKTVALTASAINEALAAKGVTLSGASAAFTISKNASSGKLELKVGDTVLGTANNVLGAIATNATTTLKFMDGSATLGTVALKAAAGKAITASAAGKLNFTVGTAKVNSVAGKVTTAVGSSVTSKWVAASAVKKLAEGGEVTVRANSAGTGLDVYVGDTKLDGATAVASTSKVKVTINGGIASITLSKVAAGDEGKIAAMLGADGVLSTGVTITAGDRGAIEGTFNEFTTENVSNTSTANNKIASTTFELTADKIKDGAYIQIGNAKYSIKVGDENKIDGDSAAGGTIYVTKELLDKGGDDLVDTAGELLSRFTANKDFTIGYKSGDNKVSVHEKTTGTGADTKAVEHDFSKIEGGNVSTMEGFSKLLGFGTDLAKGKGLTLQIGDTADDYNKLTVNIKDMHTAAMGLADISIKDQESAADAVKAIKAAINYVSDVRGTLGATQNRLDHTINNLSVMTENIQDAESTIRDTDVAEEMMAYTKNNILIQSAQAMLAQANQVPQGVLQLLQ